MLGGTLYSPGDRVAPKPCRAVGAWNSVPTRALPWQSPLSFPSRHGSTTLFSLSTIHRRWLTQRVSSPFSLIFGRRRFSTKRYRRQPRPLHAPAEQDCPSLDQGEVPSELNDVEVVISTHFESMVLINSFYTYSFIDFPFLTAFSFKSLVFVSWSLFPFG